MFTAFVRYDDGTEQFIAMSKSFEEVNFYAQARTKDDRHINRYWIQDETKTTIRAGCYCEAGYIVEWAVE